KPKLGITVTSASGNASLSQGWLRQFPASGVALEVWTVASTQVRPPAHDTAFPLEVAKFTPARKLAGGNEPTPLYQRFYGDGLQFEAAVWIGWEARTASTQAIWAAGGSGRFP